MLIVSVFQKERMAFSGWRSFKAKQPAHEVRLRQGSQAKKNAPFWGA
jgi:hypothetical protein